MVTLSYANGWVTLDNTGVSADHMVVQVTLSATVTAKGLLTSL